MLTKSTRSNIMQFCINFECNFAHDKYPNCLYPYTSVSNILVEFTSDLKREEQQLYLLMNETLEWLVVYHRGMAYIGPAFEYEYRVEFGGLALGVS